MSIFQDETISAIATSIAPAGIGVVRLSGERSFEIANSIFRSATGRRIEKSRSIMHGHILDSKGDIIDEVLIITMPSPNSYTREDVVEIQSHGGSTVLKKILQRTFESGSRPAQRGEFTKRAFLNGRLDLSQAQAVMDIVQAKTETSLARAQQNLEGKMSRRIRKLQARLIDLLANLEALIDFPDEDVDALPMDQIRQSIEELKLEIDRILETARDGKILRDGVKVALVGKPNVGKSSLLNLMLREERAIVTDIPGTTRDSIEEIVSLDGIPLVIVDTAGIREPSDEVERLGIERTRNSIDQAELILALFDSSKPLTDEDREILALIQNRNAIKILNKTDLSQVTEISDAIPMSIKFGKGEELLKHAILEKILGNSNHSESFGFIRDEREESIIRQARSELESALVTIVRGLDADCVSINLRSAWEILGEFTGENVSERVIDLIFEKFCVGK